MNNPIPSSFPSNPSSPTTTNVHDGAPQEDDQGAAGLSANPAVGGIQLEAEEYDKDDDGDENAISSSCVDHPFSSSLSPSSPTNTRRWNNKRVRLSTEATAAAPPPPPAGGSSGDVRLIDGGSLNAFFSFGLNSSCR